MRLRVVWGLFETMAIFSPTRALVSVDLPTFGRPQMVIIAVLVIIRFSLYVQQTHDLFFACAHAALVLALVHMVVAEQVQHGVHGQIADLVREAVAVGLGLFGAALPEMTMSPSMARSVS